MGISVVWFRRDIRLNDNTALEHALSSGRPVLPVFIFDSNILDELPEDDARVSFIHSRLENLNKELSEKYGSGFKCMKGDPLQCWKDLISEYEVKEVYFNKDYEPYAISRDSEITELLAKRSIRVEAFKDQVIFEEDDVLKADGKPYTVYTPYSKKWLERFSRYGISGNQISNNHNFHKHGTAFPSLKSVGFKKSDIKVMDYTLDQISAYESERDYPAKDSGSYFGPHLRFGTISIRDAVELTRNKSMTFLKELIWREFFMQILFHFPHVVDNNYNRRYDKIRWINNEDDFIRWCNGTTGYPLVDAGMRQLNQTGYMHNRVRMVTASFLCKHLLIDWKWGEAYFAARLLDYELSSNNGNWQWAAGTGCDAAPYFRVFNPMTQHKKFDPDNNYVKHWIPELNSSDYPDPIIEHAFARTRAISTYKEALNQ